MKRFGRCWLAYAHELMCCGSLHDDAGNKFKDTRKRFEAACKRMGLLDFHFHDLRHSFASWLVMAGVP